MDIQEFKALKVGDIVYAVVNTGVTGISAYQYIGIFTDHENKEIKHVFLSRHFVSVICILYGKEERSRRLKDIFLSECKAIDRRSELRKEENQLND